MRNVRNSTIGVGPRAEVSSTTTQGGARIFVLCSLCLAAGFAGGLFLYSRAAKTRSVAEAQTETSLSLSDGTRSALRRMESPVEVRFYSLLTEETSVEPYRRLAGQVDQLLAAIEHAAGGKIRLVRHLSASEAERRTAAADGLTPLDVEASAVCYQGIVVVQGNHRETLPQIAPEWAPAIEADVMRAALRVAAAAHRAARPAQTSEAELAAAHEVRNALPDLANLSAEEAERRLRETAMRELKTVANEMETQAQTARQQWERAQQTGSEAEKQTAARQLQQVQAEQTARLKTVATRLRDQIAAVERLKAASPSGTPLPSQPASAPQR